jgi:hypothetical protein
MTFKGVRTDSIADIAPVKWMIDAWCSLGLPVARMRIFTLHSPTAVVFPLRGPITSAAHMVGLRVALGEAAQTGSVAHGWWCLVVEAGASVFCTHQG